MAAMLEGGLGCTWFEINRGKGKPKRTYKLLYGNAAFHTGAA